MKWFIKALFFTLTFTVVAQASNDNCSPQTFTFNMRKTVKIQTEYLGSPGPQGLFIFIAGPEADFQQSQEFISSLCQRGFSIAAFNLEGRGVRPKDYLQAAKIVTARMRRGFHKLGSLPISVYGWSKGGDIAVKLAKAPHSKFFANVILDSPLLSHSSKLLVSTGGVRKIKVFACAEDPQEPFKSLKKLSYGSKVFLTQGEECGHWLATSPAVTGVLVDFIEGGFKQPTFFRKI